jgi:hypothetical protein
MQSVSQEARNLVSLSSTGTIGIDPGAGQPGEGSAIQDSRSNSAVANVLDEITQAFQGLFKSLTQPSTLSQSPSLFSANSAPPPADLGNIQSCLTSTAHGLTALMSGHPTPMNSLTTSTAASQPDPDWPYPDLGPTPFMNTPTGTGPTGSFDFNSTYFPTQATAQTIADMLGGQVVAQNAILSSPGSPFHQSQPNYMVQLPNGNVINPGFIAQAIATKQPRATIDALIYSEVNNTGCAPGQAPPFVPKNKPAAVAPTSAATQSSGTAAPIDRSGLDRLAGQSILSPGTPDRDPDTQAVQQQMRAVLELHQLLARLTATDQSMQSSLQNRRFVAT